MQDAQHSGIRWGGAAILIGATAFIMAGQFSSNPLPAWIVMLNPMLAAGVVYGACLPRTWAIGLVLATQLVGCVAIGLITARWDYAFYGWLQVANLAAMCVAPLIGHALLRSDRTIARRIAGGFATAVAFYLLSNFSVWALTPAAQSMYPPTGAGLAAALFAGIPYAVKNVISCVGLSVLLFSPTLGLVREGDVATDAEANAVVA